MFVLFDRLFQGYLSTAELPRDYYELNEMETVFEGRRSGAAFKLADLVRVRVIAIDDARGRVDLTRADDEEDGEQERGLDTGVGGRDESSAGPETGLGRGGKPDDGREPEGGRESDGGRHDSGRKRRPPRTRSSRTTRPPQARGRRR
jgi:hypothetical protein